MFFSWKNVLWKFSLKGPIAFGMILFHFQKFLLPWPKGKSPPISLSSSLDHDMLQIQQVEPLHIIISIYFLSKTISASYLDPWRFTKELLFLLWFLPPNLFPILVLWTLNQDPWRSTGLQFKFFKLYLLQVWTSFAKFDEIHLNSPPKNLRKFRQPLGALRGHLTKSQLQKKISACQIISSNTCWTLLLSCSVKFS